MWTYLVGGVTIAVIFLIKVDRLQMGRIELRFQDDNLKYDRDR